MPDYDRDKPTRWLAPALLEDDAVVLADDSGRVRRLTRPTDPRPRLVVTAEVNLGKGLRAAPAATGGAVVLATDDGQVRALAARDLSPLGPGRSRHPWRRPLAPSPTTPSSPTHAGPSSRSAGMASASGRST